MDKPKLFVAFVVDESSSMDSCRDSTISGFNEFFETQKKKAEGTTLVTVAKFADEVNFVFRAEDVNNIPQLSTDNYSPAGCTALYDAVGQTIDAISEDLSRETIKPGVVFVIITDGYNNVSRKFSSSKIKNLIKAKEEEGNWTFVFLGADLNAAAANDIGCSNVASYAKSATGATFAAISASTINYANTKLFAGGSLKSDNFMEEAPDMWANLDAPRGINMEANADSTDDKQKLPVATSHEDKT